MSIVAIELVAADILPFESESQLFAVKSVGKALNFLNEPFSTAEKSESIENFLFHATRDYTEAGIEQATVAK